MSVQGYDFLGELRRQPHQTSLTGLEEQLALFREILGKGHHSLALADSVVSPVASRPGILKGPWVLN